MPKGVQIRHCVFFFQNAPKLLKVQMFFLFSLFKDWVRIDGKLLHLCTVGNPISILLRLILNIKFNKFVMRAPSSLSPRHCRMMADRMIEPEQK